MKNSIYLGLLLLFVACSKKNTPLSTNSIFTILGNCDFIKGDVKNVPSGSVKCGQTLLSYNYDTKVSSVPLADVEKFKLAFRGKYHYDFFEKIHIDSKLYRLYIDSVQIFKVSDLKTHNKSLLFECSICNKVAILKFRKAIYKFPFFSDQPLEDNTDYLFFIDTIGNYYRKIYLAQELNNAGLYLEPLKNAKQSKKLSIQTESSESKEYILDLLRSVRLNN